MVGNDAESIGGFMAAEWLIIGTDGSICDKATFLNLVRSGDLTHDVMTSGEFIVRVFGDCALVISRGVSGGKYLGLPFRESERVTCVFVRRDTQWKCVLTHLSKLNESR